MDTVNKVSFEKGAKVSYRSFGVCTVDGVVTEDVLGQDMSLVVIILGTGTVMKVPEAVARRDFVLVAAESKFAEVKSILSKPPKARTK